MREILIRGPDGKAAARLINYTGDVRRAKEEAAEPRWLDKRRDKSAGTNVRFALTARNDHGLETFPRGGANSSPEPEDSENFRRTCLGTESRGRESETEVSALNKPAVCFRLAALGHPRPVPTPTPSLLSSSLFQRYLVPLGSLRDPRFGVATRPVYDTDRGVEVPAIHAGTFAGEGEGKNLWAQRTNGIHGVI